MNAPLAGSYNSINPAGGVRPDGTNRNIYQYMSEGVSRSNVLTTQLIAGRGRVHWSANYILRFSKSDAESDGTFPLSVYTLGKDYGRSLADARHSGNVGGDVNLPYGMHLWTLLRATSGAPFNIVVGRDLNGDTQYNDRPAFATDLMRPSVVVTRWGRFDASGSDLKLINKKDQRRRHADPSHRQACTDNLYARREELSSRSNRPEYSRIG